MDIFKILFLLLAVATGAMTGAALVWKSRRAQSARMRAEELKAELKKWENEGGNLAPAPEASRMP